MAHEPRGLELRHFTAQDAVPKRGPLGLRTLPPAPFEPYLELVFVHGLLGDSRLTWIHDGDESTYWPEWLLDDPTFAKTRIHTFGYEEPVYNGRVDAGSLWEIGVNLCAALENDSEVKRDLHNHIVFVAHSLGGLAVKAAIAHARQNIRLQELSRRFHYVLFLGTPHWDAGDHDMLHSILQACDTSGLIRYPEPEPNSMRVQKINDDFSTHSHNLRMCNIYEALPHPIVSRHRARLPNAREIPAMVSHANIARFRSSSDPTWDSINGILRGVANEIREQLEKPEKKLADLRKIADRFGVAESGRVDEDYLKHERDRVPGSCTWLLRKESFKKWSEGQSMALLDDEAQRIYRLVGDPGSGKSVLAAHVISHLQNSGCDVNYFFLKHGHISKQTIGALLKTIAYQKAQTSVSARRSLLKLVDEDAPPTQPNDVGVIWKQLFDRGIFQMEPEKCQYWVIDAIDEGHGSEDLITQLRSLPKSYKVFITSRREPELETAFRGLGERVVTEYINKNDTLQDIRMYLERNQNDLHRDGAELRELKETLIEKSNGLFIWVNLILRGLRNYWTDDDMETVLQDVPDVMHTLYSRILLKIADSANPGWARTILQWVICATRPLTVSELASAFRLYTKKPLRRPAEAIAFICGPLVRIEGDTVEVVHDTVRQYLFKKEGKPVVEGFEFDKAKSHERLAIVCIAFVTDRFIHRARDAFSSSASKEDPFLDYANQNFSEHLAKSGWAEESSGDTRELVNALMSFLRGYLLNWIQDLAERSGEEGLTTLTSTGKNLKAFVARRMDTNPKSVLNKQLEELQEWSDDLIHIVTVFGKDILRKPEAIKNIIPPLCPLKSKINRELGNLGVGLQVAGNPHEVWPDRISSTSFGNAHITALAACGKVYAVALRSKEIFVYAGATCQETLHVKTQDPAEKLEFASSRNWLIVTSRNRASAAGRNRSLASIPTTVSIYHYVTGKQVFACDVPGEVLALASARDDSKIITITRAKNIGFIDTKAQALVRTEPLSRSKIGESGPQRIYISIELGLLALVARNEAVELYDLDTLQQPKARIPHAANIDAIAFNNLKKAIAMCSFDGELFTIEAQSLKKSATTNAHARHMDVSTDGKILVAGTNEGLIQIREFGSLDLLHIIPYEQEEVRGLCFARSSLRFLDIRLHVVNVWEPAALIRRTDDDDSGSSAGQSSSFTSAPSQRGEGTAKTDHSRITAILEHPSGDYIFCAKESGIVSVYETIRAKPLLALFTFSKAGTVRFLAWNETLGLLASADASSTVKVHQITKTSQRIPGGTKESWQPHPKQILQTAPFTSPIRQLMFSLDGTFLLVSTTKDDHIFETRDKLKLRTYDSTSWSEQPSKWVVQAPDKRRLLKIGTEKAQSAVWEKGGSPGSALEDLNTDGQFNHESGTVRLVSIGDRSWTAWDSNHPYLPPIVWSQPVDVALDQSTETVKSNISKRLAVTTPLIQNLLGVFKRRLVFLGHDNWVCSTAVDEQALDSPIVHHFPVPPYWLNATRSLLALVTSKGDILLAINNQVVIVKNALS